MAPCKAMIIQAPAWRSRRGPNNSKGARNSTPKVASASNLCSHMGAWWMCHAVQRGKGCVSKWYDIAVRFRQLGSPLLSFTTADSNMRRASSHQRSHRPTVVTRVVSRHCGRTDQGRKMAERRAVSSRSASHWKLKKGDATEQKER